MTHTLPAAQRRALRDYLTSYLHEITSDVTDPRAVDELKRAVVDTANETCSAFTVAWKERFIIPRLPPEIFALCLRLLPFRDLVSATHVCSAWRTRALSDPLLWTSCTIRCSSPPSHVWLLSVLLQRSSPLPFHLRIVPDITPGGSISRFGNYHSITPLIRDSSARLASYRGPVAVFVSLDRSDTIFPILKSFGDFPLMDGDLSPVPPSLSTANFPSLLLLHLNQITSLAHCSPFRTVQHLSLALCADGVTTQGLFRHFPSLVSLDLRKISSSSVLPRGPLPPALVRVSLRAATRSNVSVDYTAPLASWHGSRAPSMHVTGAISPLPVLALFEAAQQPRPWALNIGRTIRLFTRQRGEAAAVIELHPRDWDRAWLSQMAPYTPHIGHVELRPTRISGFIQSRLELPALETLTLRMKGHVPRDLFDVEKQLGLGPVRAPKLRSLVIELLPRVLWSTSLESLRWATQCLPNLLRSLIIYDAEKLESISIVLPRPSRGSETSPPSQEDVVRLAALATTFSVSFSG